MSAAIPGVRPPPITSRYWRGVEGVYFLELFMRNILTIILLLIPTIASAGDSFLLKDGQRVVFLGDSNTYAGKFITYLDAYLCTRFPDKRFELINLGLPSETVCGLSEPDHPYP